MHIFSNSLPCFSDIVVLGQIGFLVLETPEGTAAHSQEYLDAGKTERAHEAIRSGSEILAGTCIDMIESPELLEQIKEEFRKRKQEEIAKI